MDLLDQKSKSKSLTSIIFDKIREDILNGKYKRGEKLVEAKLADNLGVSRTPVREALKQLELDGLVDNIPNRGVVVKGISALDVQDIYTIREAIEAIAAGWAIDRMTDEEVESLQEIYELMEFYTFKKDVDKIFELNTTFHETIYRGTKSRYFEHILLDFQQFIKSTRRAALGLDGRVESALEEHKKIVEAFKTRDKEAAVALIKRHVTQSQRLVNKVKATEE